MIPRAVLAGAALVAACSAQPQASPVAVAADRPSRSACSYAIAPAGADGVAVLRGRCDDPAAGLARALATAPDALRGAHELALGRTAFAENGIFERCAVFAKLLRDPRWTPGVDSVGAVAPLRDALTAVGPAAPVRVALGKPVTRISVETVLIDANAKPVCGAAGTAMPAEAQVWLSFE